MLYVTGLKAILAYLFSYPSYKLATIIDNIMHIPEFRMPLTAAQKKQDSFIRFMNSNAYGKKAHDGNLFDDTYTEVQTFSELEFVEDNGTLKADITTSDHYQQYYKPGASKHSVAKAELNKLAQTLGIYLDPETTNFHGTIIIRDAFSVRLLQQAGVVTKKPASKSSSPLASAPGTSFFSCLTASTASAEERDGTHQIKFNEEPLKASENQQLLDQFYVLRGLMKAKFYVEARCVWNPLSPNIIKVQFPFMHQVTNETLRASRFLYNISDSFQVQDGIYGNYSHTINQEHCASGIKFLRTLRDMSPEAIQEIINTTPRRRNTA